MAPRSIIKLDHRPIKLGDHTQTGSASAATVWAPPSGAGFPCAGLPTGAIRRLDSSRSTWSSTAAAPKTDGDYVHTLVLTDIASGWTECVPMRQRSTLLVIEALEKAAPDLPFPMRGLDSDKDSAFMTQDVFDYCKVRGLEQTRLRAYKKNDQAWVEHPIRFGYSKTSDMPSRR
jgi:hypothetical protein